MMHSGMASIRAKKSFGFGRYIARPLAAEICSMAFYTCSHSAMRSEVTGVDLGVFFSEGAARTNSGGWMRFLHWTPMQGQRPDPCRSELARDEPESATGCQVSSVIVDDHREQARSYKERWSPLTIIKTEN